MKRRNASIALIAAAACLPGCTNILRSATDRVEAMAMAMARNSTTSSMFGELEVQGYQPGIEIEAEHYHGIRARQYLKNVHAKANIRGEGRGEHSQGLDLDQRSLEDRRLDRIERLILQQQLTPSAPPAAAPVSPPPSPALPSYVEPQLPPIMGPASYRAEPDGEYPEHWFLLAADDVTGGMTLQQWWGPQWFAPMYRWLQQQALTRQADLLMIDGEAVPGQHVRVSYTLPDGRVAQTFTMPAMRVRSITRNGVEILDLSRRDLRISQTLELRVAYTRPVAQGQPRPLIQQFVGHGSAGRPAAVVGGLGGVARWDGTWAVPTETGWTLATVASVWIDGVQITGGAQ